MYCVVILNIVIPNEVLFARELNEEQKKQEDARAADYGKKKKAKKETKKKPTDKAQVAVEEDQYPNKIFWNFEGQAINFEVLSR